MDETLQSLRSTVQMRGQRSPGSCAVAVPQRLDDASVLLDLGRLVVAVELEEGEAQLPLRALVGGGEPAAAEGRHERAVEGEVALERLDEIPPAQCRREAVVRAREPVQVLDVRE